MYFNNRILLVAQRNRSERKIFYVTSTKVDLQTTVGATESHAMGAWQQGHDFGARKPISP